MGKKSHLRRLPFALLYSMPLFLAGCASEDAIKQEAQLAQSQDATVASKKGGDSYENLNRKVYGVNQDIDHYVLKPVADAYVWATPDVVRTGIRNVFNNMKDINVTINDVLQGKFAQGGEDLGRLAVNTTLGLGGMFDFASDFGLAKHEEDFGQTLAVWGIPQGPYLVLPVLGPTTLLGIPGSILDAATHPMTYVGLYPVGALAAIDARANAEGSLKFINEAAIDPYSFTREAYLQNLNYQVSDGAVKPKADEFDIEKELAENLEASKNDKQAVPKPADKPLVDETKSNTISQPQASSVMDAPQVSQPVSISSPLTASGLSVAPNAESQRAW